MTVRSGFLFQLLVLFFLCYSCGGSKDNTTTKSNPSEGDSILGTWKATWTMNDPDLKGEAPENLKVNGKLNFLDSSNVEITTYGFDGNLIMSDTTTNILNWKIEDRIMRFIDKNDVQGIPYVIEEQNEKEIRLSIMGDIQLLLKR